jgi:hypothetical protein
MSAHYVWPDTARRNKIKMIGKRVVGELRGDAVQSNTNNPPI